jgi:Bifunctional DNA primase/polymerase, N-terminal
MSQPTKEGPGEQEMSKPGPPPPSRALRIKLMKNGFLPIPLFGKAPPVYGKNNGHKGLAGWQTFETITGVQIRMWEKTWPDANNTGGLTRYAPAIDVDIMHLEAASMVEDFALGWYGRRGKICVRIGQAPKRAILLRTDKPFAKLVRWFTAPDGSRHKIEILGDGQQLVYDGIHPDTGQPYVWHGGDPSTVKRSELPDTDGAEVERFLDEVSTRLVKLFDFKPDGKKRARKANVQDNTREEVAAAPSKREAGWAAAALQNVAAELRGTEEGDRNNKLYRCAFRMGTMIARGWIARDAVELALEKAAAACGYVPDDGLKATRATIESGIEGGLECPHEDLDGGDEINGELVRLARLTVLDYELQRKAAAEQLGMRTSVLDQVVQVVRAKLGLVEEGEDGKQGHAVTFPEVEPWPEPVDGAELLDDIVDAICTYIAMANYKYDICALWPIHTYLIKHFRISPKLSIRSPMRRCGKSTR